MLKVWLSSSAMSNVTSKFESSLLIYALVNVKWDLLCKIPFFVLHVFIPQFGSNAFRNSPSTEVSWAICKCLVSVSKWAVAKPADCYITIQGKPSPSPGKPTGDSLLHRMTLLVLFISQLSWRTVMHGTNVTEVRSYSLSLSPCPGGPYCCCTMVHLLVLLY